MNDKKYLEKGSYNHHQPDGCVALKQYIIIRKDGNRCLLFRFANEFAHSVTGFEIMLTQISSDGKVLDRSRIPYHGINIVSGHIFAPDLGVVIHENCSDFRITLLSFVSGPYKYVIKHGKPVAHYDPRGYVPPKTRQAKSTQIAVRQMINSTDNIFTISAVIGAAAIVIFGILSIIL